MAFGSFGDKTFSPLHFAVLLFLEGDRDAPFDGDGGGFSMMQRLC